MFVMMIHQMLVFRTVAVTGAATQNWMNAEIVPAGIQV
ncbi:uncharacterized protein METZ01_LOCUS321356 [marine metagenome]|uniref:Uncharacterized protein n=1 Tax=marine metagenome TaxID=408172 RepID=A0A382P9A3_9ZZZZ